MLTLRHTPPRIWTMYLGHLSKKYGIDFLLKVKVITAITVPLCKKIYIQIIIISEFIRVFGGFQLESYLNCNSVATFQLLVFMHRITEDKN